MNNLLGSSFLGGDTGFTRLDRNGDDDDSNLQQQQHRDSGGRGSDDGEEMRPQSRSRNRDAGSDYGDAGDDGEGEEGGTLPGMDLSAFNADVAEVRQEIEATDSAVASLRGTHEEAKLAAAASTVKALHARMDSDVLVISKKAKGVKEKIEELKDSNETNRKYDGCGPGSATDRHRTAVTLSLAKKLKDVVTEFQQLREQMARDHRETVDRRLQIITGEKVAGSDLDRIIETGQSEGIIAAAITAQGDVGGVRDAVLEIEERHSAVQEITRSLQELQQMFLDMATMVESQGELLDNIEVQVESSTEHVEKSVEHLQQAVETQKNTRKWMWIGAGIVAVVILVILIPTVVSAMQ